jgi:hypothetical protein
MNPGRWRCHRSSRVDDMPRAPFGDPGAFWWSVDGLGDFGQRAFSGAMTVGRSEGLGVAGCSERRMWVLLACARCNRVSREPWVMNAQFSDSVLCIEPNGHDALELDEEREERRLLCD